MKSLTADFLVFFESLTNKAVEHRLVLVVQHNLFSVCVEQAEVVGERFEQIPCEFVGRVILALESGYIAGDMADENAVDFTCRSRKLNLVVGDINCLQLVLKVNI